VKHSSGSFTLAAADETYPALKQSVSGADLCALVREGALCMIEKGKASSTIENSAHFHLFSKNVALQIRKLFEEEKQTLPTLVDLVDAEENEALQRAFHIPSLGGYFTYDIINAMVVYWDLRDRFLSVYAYIDSCTLMCLMFYLVDVFRFSPI
jgi:hypothetical protein